MRTIRWLAAGVILAVSLIALVSGAIESCTTTITESAGREQTVSACSPLALNSAAVLAVVLLFMLLIWPDLAEVGAFGVTMKRRIEATEQLAQSAVTNVSALGNRLEVQAIRLDTAVSSVSTASASATVPIMIGDFELSKAVQGLEAKIDAFLTGTPIAKPDSVESSDEQNALRVELLENAEWLREAFPYVFVRGKEVRPDPRRVSDAADEARVARFLNVFREELEIVRAARNTVAHAQQLSDDELRKAVDISRRLRQIVIDTPID